MANGTATRLHEEPFDWVVRSLANVLGVPPTQVPLRRDRPLSAASDAELASLNSQLAARFVRVEDPLTGQVSYAVHGPAIALDVGETQVEELARRAVLVLPGVRTALDEIDPDVCRPNICSEDVRSLVDSSRATIDQLDAELRGDAAEPVVDTLFNELLAEADEGGWIALLARTLDQGIGEPTDSVAHERQRTLLAIVSESLESLHHAWDQYRDGGDDLGAPLAKVQLCAGHITEQSVAIRMLLADHGIGRCELEAVVVNLPNPVWIGGETAFGRSYRNLSLADLLRHAEHLGQRLPVLARLGRGYQLATIWRAARTLGELVEHVETRAVVEGQLHLVGDGADAAVAAIERLRGLIRGFVRLLDRRQRYGEDDGGGGAAPKDRPGGGPRNGGGRAGGGGSNGRPGGRSGRGPKSGSPESSSAKAPDAERAPLST